MFYFKEAEFINSETKTGPTGSFIKYVEKHSCYKAAEEFLLALAEKNKESAVEIFPPRREKKSSVDFYFEEIELSEEKINAFKLLGQDKKALLDKTPVIIQLHFRFKSDDCKEDALDFIIRKYRYIGYNAEGLSDTGWIKQERQSEFILTYKSPEKIFFCCNSMQKSFPASITSLYILCNINDDAERKYARLFVTSMLEHLSEITGSKIYIDLLNEKSEDGQLLNPCPLKIAEMKDFRTKKELFYGKYGKLLNKYSIPKKTFNKYCFNWDYKIVNFVKYMGGDFIPELLQLEECPDDEISQRKSKEIIVSIFTQILMKRYPLVTYICTDIGKMMSQLLYDSLKEFRKHLPSRSILEGRKKLMEYHDSLVNVFEQLYEDDVFDELEIEHRKTQEQIKQDRKVYECFAEQLPSPWKEFTEPEELVHESHIMENCIRTYCQDLAAAECGLYWAEINGRRYNAEVIFNKDENRMNLIQLYGKKNSNPVKKDINSFIKYIENFNKKIQKTPSLSISFPQ